MHHQHYNVLGIMSGTSLDGIDLVHVRFKHAHEWSFEIIHSDCINYNDAWKKRLQDGINIDNSEHEQLDQDYTHLLASVCNTFIDRHNIKNLTAICSHGHTIAHEPQYGRTVQIGNLSALARLTDHRVVCDFRVQDVKLGGQGAPLVPIGDQLLFSQYDYCLNLGGFANVSFMQDGERIAYDICAVNVVLNQYSRLLSKSYDENGAFAKAGTPQKEVLKQLNQLPFYKLPAPKSLGIEWVNEHVYPILKSIKDPRNAIATYTHHAAQQIALSLPTDATIVSTGGGTYNNYLLELINASRSKKVSIPDTATIEYKEAVIFGLLGVLRLRNANNCLSSVTGAITDHSSGEIYVP